MASPLASADAFALHPTQLTTNDSARFLNMSGIVWKTILCFAVLAAGGALGFKAPLLAIMALIGVITLGIIIWRKKVRNPFWVLLFACSEGVLFGGISSWIDQAAPGVLAYFIAASISTLGVIMVGYASKAFVASLKKRDALSRSLIAMVVFALAATGLAKFSDGWSNFDYLGTDMGIPVVVGSILGVLLLSIHLIRDYTYIGQAIENRISAEWEWFAAFSIIGGLLWFYYDLLEMIWFLLTILSFFS